MSDKIQIGIYAIKDEINEFVRLKPTTTKVDVSYLTKYLTTKKKYKQQQTNGKLSKDFDIHLFFRRKPSNIAWKDFIRTIAHPSSDILKNDKNANESYIILFKNVKNDKIYATTGGHGHTALQGLTENDFGLEILSRIIKADDKTIHASKEKNFTGGILGEIKFFRNNYNLNENENFGNFYQELQSSLNKDILKKFGFSQSDIDKERLCIAKNSFTIKKAISFDELIVIIKSCEKLITATNPVVEINNVRKLGKADQVLTSELEQQISEACYDEYSSGNSKFEIELCHSEFDKYLNATQFIFSYKIRGDKRDIQYDQPIKKLSTLMEEIRNNTPDLDLDKLFRVVKDATIESQDSSGNLLTADYLENHFYTEIFHSSKSYFLYEKEWYEIKDSFITKLNSQCGDFIIKNTFKGKLDRWDYKNEIEDDFNKKHIGNSNTIVLHKITPENIEACDILHWDTTNVYFIHVKAGFDNSMRDLAYQIWIAAKRINEDTRTGFAFLKQVYQQVKHYNGTNIYLQELKGQFKNIKETDFLKLFESRKLVFVLAVFDTANTKRRLSNIKSFGSNIAKFSLNELIKNLRGIDIGFQIHDIL